MSRESNKSNSKHYSEADFSGGDSNKMGQYREENNNEVDELSKELGMGCIVDAVKRPPNICVETCVYEESGSEVDEKSGTQTQPTEEENYSDEFEDEGSDDEIIVEPKLAKSENADVGIKNNGGAVMSRSHHSISKPASVSGRSSGYGSISVPKTRRINMSFTNDRLREIDRHNHILLNKILSARNSRKSSIPPREQPKKKILPPAAMHKKQVQRQIDRDNLILLRKIQHAKSTSCSLRR